MYHDDLNIIFFVVVIERGRKYIFHNIIKFKLFC